MEFPYAFKYPTRLISRFQGAFDSFEHEHLPRTKYDAIVDGSSNKPGEQAFEVYSSGCITFRLLTDNYRNSSLGDTWGKSCGW